MAKYVTHNTFVPISALKSSAVPSSNSPATDLGRTLGQALSRAGAGVVGTLTNPAFSITTAGTNNPLGPNIQRGYIRRARTTGPGANAVLRFMYNPSEIVRDYVSYMDQAAIDPYNTLFQSGNLVAPPSIVNFTFEMLFDRGVEDAQGENDRGVLVDMDFFDLVVRNVQPNNSGTTQVPDNGVMMVNPEDIVVVFGEHLTVQGRPINSQTRYQKFNEKMVPTRALISLTMVINYFGPLRTPFGLDTTQAISNYEALVPYSEVTNGPLNAAEILNGVTAFQENARQDQEQHATDLQQLVSFQSGQWWGGTGGTASGSATAELNMTGPINQATALRALAVAQQTFNGSSQYSQTQRTRIPQYADCSSLVWYCFNQVGAGKIFGPGAWPSTQAMLSYWQSSKWATMQPVLQWNSSNRGSFINQLLAQARPGDLLFVYNGSAHHIAFVQQVSGNSITTFDAANSTANPQVGARTRSASSCVNFFNYLLRPVVAGSQSVGNGIQNGGAVWS